MSSEKSDPRTDWTSRADANGQRTDWTGWDAATAAPADVELAPRDRRAPPEPRQGNLGGADWEPPRWLCVLVLIGCMIWFGSCMSNAHDPRAGLGCDDAAKNGIVIEDC
jgi:hypothetical protein